MPIGFYYLTASDILNKAEREAHRAFHEGVEGKKEAMCDHFYNFCVTAHSIVQWLQNSKEVSKEDLKFDFGGTHKELSICRDIANWGKHFSLTYTAQTIGHTTVEYSAEVDFCEGSVGNLVTSKPRETVTIYLLIDKGPPQEFWKFTRKVIEFWIGFFKVRGIPFVSIYERLQAEQSLNPYEDIAVPHAESNGECGNFRRNIAGKIGMKVP